MAHNRRSPWSLHEYAHRAIADFTGPGDLIIDPMCGAGDTLVAAIEADRLAIGVEHQKYWAEMAQRRIEAATGSSMSRGYAVAVHGDPFKVSQLVGPDVKGRVALVIASPQNGTARSVNDPETVCGDLDDLATGFTVVFRQCRELLRPGGHLVVITVPVRHDGRRFDLDEMAHESALGAGFAAVTTTSTAEAPFSVYKICDSVPASGKAGACEDPRA